MTKQELPAPDPMKPQRRGLRMDFAPKVSRAVKPAPVTKPTTKPVQAPKPAPGPAPTPVKKPASKPLAPPPMEPKSVSVSVEKISATGTPRRHSVGGLRMDFVRRTTIVKAAPKPVTQKPVSPKVSEKPAAPKPITNPASLRSCAPAAPKMVAPVKIATPASRAQTPAPAKPVENSAKSAKIDKIPVRAQIVKKPFIKKIIQIVEKPKEEPKAEIAPEIPESQVPVQPAPSKKQLAKDLEPLMEDENLAIALAGFVDDEEAEDYEVPEEIPQDSSDFDEEISALDELDEIDAEIEEALRDEAKDFVAEPKPLFKEVEEKPEKPDYPDANRYSLGGKSPFLTSVSVEKRPLSAYVPEANINRLKPAPTTPAKNSYREKVKSFLSDNTSKEPHQTMIISVPSKNEHNTTLFIAIALTVLLGALVGGLIYLVFFQ